jgi:poly(3-hydroxybutyrate) depolymerase
MFKYLIPVLLIVSTVSLNAQSINLRGKITNKNGQPISGAYVALARQGLNDTTGTDGSYSIHKSDVAVLSPIAPRFEKITLNNGIMELTLSITSKVKIAIFDVQGNLIKQENIQNVSYGVYHLNIAELTSASQVLIIQVTIDDKAVSFRYLPLGHGNYLFKSNEKYPFSEKLSKMDAVMDTLIVTASGYTAKSVAIYSFNQELNITLDSVGSTIPSIGCGKIATLKNGTRTIKSSNTNRQYIIDIPANYNNNTPYRLFFGFHWYGGTMQDVATGQTVQPKDTWKFYGLKRIADSTKTYCIFVAPQGLNDGGGNGWANPNGRDVTFVDDMIKEVTEDLCIDKSRIFSVGFSYGGMMGNTLTCERPDVFRAVASHNGAGSCSKSQKPIAFLGIAGTIEREGVRTTAIRIAKANGCKDTMPAFPASGSKGHLCTEFQGCNSKYPVKFCAFDAGHKAAPFDGGGDVDDGNKTWVPGTDWEFFMRF